jgi:hypothetical protein
MTDERELLIAITRLETKLENMTVNFQKLEAALNEERIKNSIAISDIQSKINKAAGVVLAVTAVASYIIQFILKR